VVVREFGIFQALYFAPSQDTTSPTVSHDTYIAKAIEFSKPVCAQVLATLMEMLSQPGNSHVGDQLALYARKQLRPVWRTRGRNWP